MAKLCLCMHGSQLHQTMQLQTHIRLHKQHTCISLCKCVAFITWPLTLLSTLWVKSSSQTLEPTYRTKPLKHKNPSITKHFSWPWEPCRILLSFGMSHNHHCRSMPSLYQFTAEGIGTQSRDSVQPAHKMHPLCLWPNALKSEINLGFMKEIFSERNLDLSFSWDHVLVNWKLASFCKPYYWLSQCPKNLIIGVL